MNTVEILLSSGKSATVDAADLHVIAGFVWHENTKGYAVAYKGAAATRKAIYMHALIAGKGCDHRDLNKLNNRISNLRPATASQNSANKEKCKGTFSSKFKGVCWYKAYSKWKAYLHCKPLKLHLGYFVDEIEAARAYNTAALKNFGPFARFNKL
jgi:HNH endonuclease